MFFDNFKDIYKGGKLAMYTNGIGDRDIKIIVALQLIANIHDKDILQIQES